jgi:D-3-phosphoglycerate dehydrogenase / 2-oxoglutarate reductase
VHVATIVVADPIADEGLELLRAHADVKVVTGQPREALERALHDADALLVRSETRVTAALLECGPRLRVIGRAGAGVDTIDVAAATARGIVVVNAPGGNAVAAAEHSLALMFALARRIAAADAALKQGEWARSKYTGTELTGKTLGLIGLGRVGAEVARRALGLDMRVLVYDPYVPVEHARHLGLEAVELEALLESADFVSLHVPLTEATRGILNAERLRRMRPGAFLVNCARGGLVDNVALLEALDEGRLAGAAIDVFETEPVPDDDPLPRHPRVVATPHLGASTLEAQANVAAQVAQEVLAVLDGRPAQFAVNAPTLRPEDAEALQPYLELVRMLGKLATQLAQDHVRSAEIGYRGEILDGGRDPGIARAHLGYARQPRQRQPAGASARPRRRRDALQYARRVHQRRACDRPHAGGRDERGGCHRRRSAARGADRRVRAAPARVAWLPAGDPSRRPAGHDRACWHAAG